MSFARVRALTVVGVLFVCAIVLVTMALIKDNQPKAANGGACPPGHVPADLRLPAENKDVKINVLNATGRTGLAGQIATDFENREFVIANKNVINSPDAKERAKANYPKSVPGVALLRYGPKTVGAAWVLRAYFLDEADVEFDIKRKDDIVDVVIGQKFQQLATVTEMHQALAALQNPDLPEGTCAA
jgi:hypothetical protein